MDQNEERGMRDFLSKQRGSRLRSISRKNYGRSIGKRRKFSFTAISWQIFEGSFMTLAWIYVSANVWIRTAMQHLKSWQRYFYMEDRRVSFIRVFDIVEEPALRVFGQLW